MLSWQTSYLKFEIYMYFCTHRELNNSLLTVICTSISRSTMQYNNYIILELVNLSQLIVNSFIIDIISTKLSIIMRHVYA